MKYTGKAIAKCVLSALVVSLLAVMAACVPTEAPSNERATLNGSTAFSVVGLLPYDQPETDGPRIVSSAYTVTLGSGFDTAADRYTLAVENLITGGLDIRYKVTTDGAIAAPPQALDGWLTLTDGGLTGASDANQGNVYHLNLILVSDSRADFNRTVTFDICLLVHGQEG